MESCLPNHCCTRFDLGLVHDDFGHVLEDHVKVYDNVPYTAFLLPGLIMMSVLQNAFANSSSSLVQSKIMGNIVFLLLTPLSHWHWYVAYVGSSMLRGLAVGFGVLLSRFGLRPCSTMHPFDFGVCRIVCRPIGCFGFSGRSLVRKFDQMAAFQSFVIMPMTFLSGVFYSIHSLPPFWQGLSHLNPFFYMIDGFRYGFLVKAMSRLGPVWPWFLWPCWV